MDKQDYKKKKNRLKKLLKGLEEEIMAIDKEIQSIIDNDDILSNQYRLLCSVDNCNIFMKLCCKTS